MAGNGVLFVEWKEEFVSQERGSRVVHYILKDSCGKSIVAVVGTERSLRHMVYVVAEEFLSYSGTENPVQAGFKWRSRREVVDWLTSLLAKQHQADSPSGDSTQSLGSSELFSAQHFSADELGHRVRNLKESDSDIVWIGAPWTCGKQLRHYPAFCRNGTTIAVQSFVFVMAKQENRYIAYLDDMYEDKKGQKKVRVRWFHHSQEMKRVVRLRNAHPKEVYITPYTQVISVECVDGPAIVLTRDHFQKCIRGFPDGLLGKVHLCCREFRSNKIKPFNLNKLKGYFNQPVISCLESNTILNSDSTWNGVTGDRVKVFKSGEKIGKATKRSRNSGDRESFLTSCAGTEGLIRKKVMCAPLCKSDNSDMLNIQLPSFKNLETLWWHSQLFKVGDKIELLCQDSGIRGCWFRCTILEISRKRMKFQYSDVEDQDGYGNLEEWVPAFRLAAPDKLGMRRLGRPTIRPFPPVSNSLDAEFEVGDPVDAWWSDGWWEVVVTAIKNAGDDTVQVYVPGENLFLNVTRKDLRVSRDWMDGKWVDVKAKPDVLCIIDTETKPPACSSLGKDDEADEFALKAKVDENEDKEASLPATASSISHPEQVSSLDKDEQNGGHDVNEKSDDVSGQGMHCDCDVDNQDDPNIGNDDDDGPKEAKSVSEDTKTAPQYDEALELKDVVALDVLTNLKIPA